MSTSATKPMRKGGLVALSAAACTLALVEVCSTFFYYSYDKSGALDLTIPVLKALVSPLLALAACVLLVFVSLCVQKSTKLSPLGAVAFWAMALSFLAKPVFLYHSLSSLHIALCVLVCAVLITAGLLSINQLRSIAMPIIVMVIGVGFAGYQFADSLPLLQNYWQKGEAVYIIGSIAACLIPLLFCIALPLLELCKPRLAAEAE